MFILMKCHNKVSVQLLYIQIVFKVWGSFIFCFFVVQNFIWAWVAQRKDRLGFSEPEKGCLVCEHFVRYNSVKFGSSMGTLKRDTPTSSCLHVQALYIIEQEWLQVIKTYLGKGVINHLHSLTTEKVNSWTKKSTIFVHDLSYSSKRTSIQSLRGWGGVGVTHLVYNTLHSILANSLIR